MTVDLPLTTPHRVIRASAGSGKTFQLTSHYLRLLRAGSAPSTILATTFTRKAAGEIQGNILTRLVEAIDDSSKRQQLAEHTGGGELTRDDCLNLLHQLVQGMHRLAIATIDGFFNRIARGFRFELDLPPEPRLVDASSPTAQSLRSEAIAAMLADADVSELLTLLRRLHHDTTARSVTAALDQIVVRLHETYRQAPDRASWDQLSAPEPMHEHALQRAIDRLQACEAELPTTKKGAPNQTWAKALANNIQAAWLGQWESFLATGLTPKIADGAAQFSSKPIPQPIVEAYTPLIEHARAVILDRVRHQHLARFDLLARFDRHYEQRRRDQNVLLFSDLTDALARRMPRLDPGQLMDIYFRLDAQVQHLLLDEFQDTSLDQWSVLQPFAEEITAQGESSPAQPARSFFCVGDTKQAIYGWRGGCAALLDELGPTLHLPESAFDALNRSFRSCQPVLDTVNIVFTTIRDNTIVTEHTAHTADGEAAASFAKAFTPHAPAEQLEAISGYVCLETSPAEPSDDEARAAEDRTDVDEAPVVFTGHEAYAAERVRTLHETNPHHTIGVLVSTNKMATRMIYELRQLEANGQPLVVSGEGGAPLTDCQPVNAILSAMTLADHPGPDHGRSAAAFHVVNSPLGEVLGLTSTAPTAVERISRTIRRSLLSDGYANLISQWVQALAPHCHARSLARLEQLVTLAEQYEPELTLRPTQFVKYVDATPVEQAQPATIRVMTIHRAKGLQFDTVVLPQLDKPLGDDFDLLMQRNGPTGEVQAVHPCPNQAIRALSPTLEQAHQDRRRQRRYEDLCGLYVALTRAKRSVHMLIRPPGYTKKGELSKPALCYGEILRTALSNTPRGEERGGEVLYHAGDQDWLTPTQSDRATSATSPSEPALHCELAPIEHDRPRRAWLVVSPSSLGQADTLQPADLLRIGGDEARHRGTLFHRWFERVGFLDDPDGQPTREQLANEAHTINPVMDERTLASLIDEFEKMLAQPAIHTALSRARADDRLWREHPFAVRDAGRLLQGRFDRVVLHGDTIGHIDAATLIDFKTDRIDNDGHLDKACDRYEPQLSAYRRALAQMLALRESAITATLMFVEPGRCVNV